MPRTNNRNLPEISDMPATLVLYDEPLDDDHEEEPVNLLALGLLIGFEIAMLAPLIYLAIIATQHITPALGTVLLGFICLLLVVIWRQCDDAFGLTAKFHELIRSTDNKNDYECTEFEDVVDLSDEEKFGVFQPCQSKS